MATKVLIVGCGLSGATLALQLTKQDFNVTIYDLELPNTASRVAAGLINPITGKRFVKSWLTDQLLVKAKEYYTAFEEQHNCKIFQPIDIDRIIPNNDILAQWQTNIKSAIEEGYVDEEIRTLDSPNLERKPFLRIKKSAWLDVTTYLNTAREYLKTKGVIVTEKFNHKQLDAASLTYNNESYDKVIFCEGAAVVENPYFPELPIRFNKGEILTVTSSDLTHKNVLKHNIFILPIGNEQFKIGATYNKEQVDSKISSAGKQELLEKTERVFTGELTVKEHKAAIRPATRDRRPIMGEHKDYSGIHIFNGFGAKGVSLIPYFSEIFVDYLADKEELSKEVSPYR